MRHIMVDLETTGIDPGRHAILQIAAWRFDLKEGEIDMEPFNRCLRVPPHRHWNEGTRNWWHETQKQANFLKSIQMRAEDPAEVMKAFVDWTQPETNPVFWSKPSHFDFMFVSSYLADYGLMQPFHYRATQDMNSFIRGLHFPEEPPAVVVEMEGDAHDAIWDALNQIQTVWAHLKAKEKSAVNAPFQEQDMVAEVVG